MAEWAVTAQRFVDKWVDLAVTYRLRID